MTWCFYLFSLISLNVNVDINTVISSNLIYEVDYHTDLWYSIC